MTHSPENDRDRVDEYLRRVSCGATDLFLPAAAPQKLYRAGEVAQHLGLTRQTIHNYATIGLISEDARTPGGQRLFGESVFARLGAIQRLKSSHRLEEIRRLLNRQTTSAADAESEEHGAEG